MLTFIIPTIGRKSLKNTIKSLYKQTDSKWKCIIIFDGIKPNIYFNDSRIKIIKCDKLGKGVNSAGNVRNYGMQFVDTKWISFVDDDDMISPFYIRGILTAIQDNPDCVGIEGIITCTGMGPKKFIHSLQYTDWYEQNDVYYRCPNHLNPIKREIALDTKFPETSWQEDKDFSHRLAGKLKSEVYIKGPIYFYYPSRQ